MDNILDRFDKLTQTVKDLSDRYSRTQGKIEVSKKTLSDLGCTVKTAPLEIKKLQKELKDIERQCEELLSKAEAVVSKAKREITNE